MTHKVAPEVLAVFAERSDRLAALIWSDVEAWMAGEDAHAHDVVGMWVGVLLGATATFGNAMQMVADGKASPLDKRTTDQAAAVDSLAKTLREHFPAYPEGVVITRSKRGSN